MDLQVFNLSYFDKNSKFGNIELDAVLSQDITLSNIVSEHPYEDGSMVADGIHNEPIKISLSAVISDLPQTFVEQAKQLSNTNLATLMGNKYLSNSIMKQEFYLTPLLHNILFFDKQLYF